MSIVSCQKWSKVFLDEDLDAFVEDGRGGRRGSAFWDCYQELEFSAREFSIGACSRKANSFTVQELAEFVTNKFYELYNFKKVDDTLIRSVQSLRVRVSKATTIPGISMLLKSSYQVALDISTGDS